jgi:glycosyltransferase involved in cell wall biosynthesis
LLPVGWCRCLKDLWASVFSWAVYTGFKINWIIYFRNHVSNQPANQLTPRLESRFEALNACVLLPTFNNAQTLAAVMDGLLEYTTHIIVVNDGSTDTTPLILEGYPDLKIISYSPNRGKGMALRTGLRAAADAGYDYAISIDSDGQHYPSDLPVFLDEIEKKPGALLVGARNMTVENVPTKSSFGNRFSNFWYWVNTGIRLPDTQSGYRLYPVQRIGRKRYFTRKYEFEIEVLVRAAWSGVPVCAVPVSVYYPPAGERISHFRPFKDFSRISVLNTVLVSVALFWIKPRDLTRSLLSVEGWKRLCRSLFRHPQESNLRKASSVGFGVFMGIAPVWGFQLAIGIPLAFLLRLNKALFLIAANISIFPLTAFWLLASLVTGKWLLGETRWMLSMSDVSLERVSREGLAFIYGGAVLALAMGLLAFLLTLLGLKAFRRARA